MARYFFDTYDGFDHVHDHEGVDLASQDDVVALASRELGEMAADALPNHTLHAFSVTVRNDSNRPVYHGSMTLFAQWLNHN